MSLLVSREGNLSLFRVGLLIAAIGIGIGVAGFLFVQFDQAQRRSPFYIDVFPGATEWYTDQVSDTFQRVVYQVPDVDAATVAEYYQRELDDHLGAGPGDPNREECVRTPAFNDFPDYVPGSGNVPFFHRCAFDNSTFGATQFTIVTIQPGVRNDETGLDTTGSVIIEYEQRWSS